MTACTQHAFFLTSNGRSLSATCFTPAAAKGAVLFVPPFCEERKGALPAMVQTARALAGQHIASLVFDFSGCGDSAGDFACIAPETFEADCEAAWAWLGQAFPKRPRAAVGLRTGVVLAARLAAQHPEMAALAAWAPMAGRDFIRQLMQRRMVNDMVAYGKAQESRAELEATLRCGGTVDLDGYPVTGAFYAWLQALSPLPVHPPLLIFSGGHDEKTCAAFATLSPLAQCIEIRYPPFWNTVGHVDLSGLTQETTAWLSERLTAANAAGCVKEQPTQPLLRLGMESADLVTLPGPAAVRAIFDVPTMPPHAGALFLHGWSGDRTGPHRLFTRFARQLTLRGYLCLRPDFIGRGLSDGEASAASIAGMAVNAQAALEALRARLPHTAPIIVIAICSGCKVAVTLAAGNPSLAQLLLWSPESMGSLRSAATGWLKTWDAFVTYARKLTRPETWKKLLSGKVQAGLVTKALVKHETRSNAEAAHENETLVRFRGFRNPVLFVFGGSDPDAAGSRCAYSRYCNTHGIPQTTHTVPHAGHSYYSAVWTDKLFEVSLRFIST